MSNPRSQDARFSRSEGWWVGGLILVVLALNLLTGARSPAVWIDEAAYTDPAWNLYLGDGFTSSAWYAQEDDEFWAGNVPLHSALLYLWMIPFGTSILSVRAINYLFISVAALLLWLAVKRLGLIARPQYRVVLVALVLSGFGISFNYRSGRPDGICILLSCAVMLAYSIPHRPARWAVVGGLGILFPIAGLQLVFYAALLCLLLLPFLRAKYLGEAVVLAAGCLAGIGLLFVFYSSHGVWDDFLASTLGTHSAAGREGFVHRLGQLHIPGGLKDPSFLLVLSTTLALALWAKVQRRFVWRSPLGFSVAVGVLMPIVLYGARGQYPCYYSWMAYVPVCVCLCTVLATRVPSLPRVADRVVVPALLTLSCLVGLPLLTGMTVAQWEDRDYRQVENLVREELGSGDVVYCDGAAYYAVKQQAAFDVGHRRLLAMTPRQKARLSALVIDPRTIDAVRPLVGGRWQPCGQPLEPSHPPLFGVESEYFFSAYRLQVFRRR